MRILQCKLTTIEAMLGTASNNKELHSEFIASHAPDAPSREEEIAAVGVDEVIEKGMTVFSRNKDGNPILWDYQIKGFFKDACGVLRKVKGTKSSKIKAYKKEIDGLIFVQERQIPVQTAEEMGSCQRSLRANTPQGERVGLANSEEIAAGAVLFNVSLRNAFAMYFLASLCLCIAPQSHAFATLILAMPLLCFSEPCNTLLCPCTSLLR